MADKKEKKKKVEIKLERVYNVPLRRQWLKAPLYRRAKRAISALRQFLARNMKTDIKQVRIGKYANLKMWERGIRFPPHHIKVIAKKDEEGFVLAELEGAPVEKKAGEKKQKPKKEEPKPEAKPEEKTAEEKKAELPKAEEKKEEVKKEKKPTVKKPKEKTAEEKK